MPPVANWRCFGDGVDEARATGALRLPPPGRDAFTVTFTR